MKEQVLIYYARLPEKHFVGKTRLGHDIKNQSAANQLAQALILDMIDEYLPKENDIYDVVWYYQGDKKTFFHNHPKYNHLRYIKQPSHELSMDHIHTQMAKEYKNILIVGSDLPLIQGKDIQAAFQRLQTYDCVLIPTQDGGYGLLAMRGFHDVYSHITNWESRSPGYHLFSQTIQKIKDFDLSLYTFPQVFDIDYKADLQQLWQIITNHGRLCNPYAYLHRTHRILATDKIIFTL